MQRGVVVRCFLSGALATLLLLHANPAFAANPTDIEVVPDDSYSQLTYTRDWRPYCSPGHTNSVSWYMGDGTLVARENGLDCTIGHGNSETAHIPGAISLWSAYPSNILPAGLPHQNVPFSGPDGDFYFTLTSNVSRYSTSSPANIQVLPDPAWNGYSQFDLSTGWDQYCTPGPTNTLRWYTSNNILSTTEHGYDCANGHGNSATPHIPGAVFLWNFSSIVIPASLPHNPFVFMTGQEGDFYLTLTNADNQVTRYDWTWNTTSTVKRFDWGWHNGEYTFPIPVPPPPPPQYCVAGSTPDCNSNVMFLPGIEGSRLFSSGSILGENQLWEPNSLLTSDVSQLDMRNANTADNIYTKIGDIIDTAYKDIPGVQGKNIYATFISDMNNLVIDGKIQDWEPVAYDWRLDYQDLLNQGRELNGRIYYRGTNAATSTPYIAQQLKRLAASSRTGKVTIISHSNGGLLAKEISSHSDLANIIDKVILVASPQLGTPAAIGGLLHGFKQGLPQPATILFTDADARELGQNMPMAYNLIPSAKYFQVVSTPVVTFDSATIPEWAQKYGAAVLDQTQLRTFMTDGMRTKPTKIDLVNPEVTKPDLFDNSTQMHITLDDWVAPPNVQMVTIAGWGNETLSSIEYKKVPQFTCIVRAADNSCSLSGINNVLTYSPQFSVDGDGTVIETSATWGNNVPTTRYWIDLMAINSASTATVGHGDIFETATLRELANKLVTNSTNVVLPQNVSTSKPVYNGNNPRLNFILHSPLTLSFKDPLGNYSGLISDGVVSNIPGVEYRRFGEVQWLSVPKNITGQLIMHGTGSGSFTLDIKEVNGNNIVATAIFAAVPSSTSTVATININPNSSPTANAILNVDFDGDGNIDRAMAAKQGGTVLPDFSAPEIQISVSTSTRDISIKGIDDVSPTTFVNTAATSTTISDASGNKTTLYFKKSFAGKNISLTRLTGINYGTTTTPLPSSFVYIWDSANTLISQTVIVDGNFVIEALYNKKKDKTTILVKKKGLPIQNVTVPGLKLLRLITNKGSVSYSW